MLGTNNRSSPGPKNMQLAGSFVGISMTCLTSPRGERRNTTPPSQIASHMSPSASIVAPSGIGP
jgi:hypothetical protein